MRRVVVLEMALALTILSAPPVCGQTLADVEHDLELVIRCDQKDLKRGDEIPIVFRLTNKGETVYKYDDRDADRSGRMPEYVLEARRAEGAVVADPWADREEWFGGGLTSRGEIGPGESFEKTIPLNRWALVKQAGRYEVVGKYLYRVRDELASRGYSSPPMREVAVESRPIELVVGPRSPQEMGKYISLLTEALKTVEPEPEDVREQKRRLNSIITRLVYTCDERIVPTLIEMMYSDRRGNGAFWACHGLRFYLPQKAQIKSQLVDAAQRRGLGRGMQSVLEEYGCGEEVFGEAIGRTFESGDEKALFAAVYATQNYPDDAYMEKLIELAQDANSPTRHAAILAVAYNRTDDGVAAIRGLLENEDEVIRKSTERAIEQAYRRHPVRPERIDEEYTAALAGIVRDMNDPSWYGAVNQVVRTRTKEGFAALLAYLENPEESNAVFEKDEGLRAIRDMLRDSDAKMRSYREQAVRRLCQVKKGRPLRADDFGAEYQDFDARQREMFFERLRERHGASD